MSEIQPSSTMAAKTALFAAGFELAGVKLQLFAQRLLEEAAASPGASCNELVRKAVRAIDGGAIGVVSEEPALCDHRLSRPAWTVDDAVQAALDALARTLLDARSAGVRRPHTEQGP